MSLELIKERFNNPAGVLMLRGNKLALDLLIGWTLYRPAFVDSAFRSGEDEAAALARYWQSIWPIDFKKLGVASGIPWTRAEKMFERLKAGLFLWPDGTVSTQAREVLAGERRIYLRGLGYMPRPPMPEPPKTTPPMEATDAGQRPQAANPKIRHRPHPVATARSQKARP